MRIRLLMNGNLRMSCNVNERAELQEVIVSEDFKRGSIAATMMALSSYLDDPMGDGIDYDFVDPDEVRTRVAFVLSDGDHLYGNYNDRLLENLARAVSVTWKRL